MSMRFKDRVVIITGAAGGIGGRAAARFSAEGALLTLIDRSHVDLIRIREELGIPDSRCLYVAADISNETAVKEAVENTVSRFGRLDVMFNNAGVIGASAKLADFPAESMRKVLDINVMGTFFGMKYALQAMVPAGQGVIINTCSISGCRGMPDTAAYVASKHAIMGMTRSTAVEYARSGIRVCAVCPSPVATPMMQAVEDGMVNMGLESRQVIREKLVSPIPMGRYATAEEVVSAVMFLASDDASFITGSAIMVDGAFTA